MVKYFCDKCGEECAGSNTMVYSHDSKQGCRFDNPVEIKAYLCDDCLSRFYDMNKKFRESIADWFENKTK